MTQRYWNRVDTKGGWLARDPRTGRPLGPPPGEDLAALRAGLGRDAGEVPRVWRFYTCPIDDHLAQRDQVSVQQRAEHAALALYGLHQQSKSTSMHDPKVPLGHALHRLRVHGRFSAQAVDARVNAAATATSPTALLMRLRGLIDQLRVINQPVDYDGLMQLIHDWHYEDGRRRARRRWAVQYQVWAEQDDQESDDAEGPTGRTADEGADPTS
ncbi:type I-E CRISPR-associated protein Cse2/CasB [Actinomadura latina]|uniref:Type I-E CRISPR-associated protein Cse2/CasB n=1 Tax=Actinomadura latina TaxID=163603 RepID=A0A846Z7L3_9ACTN|nr:type I-E CRISPR-associated protein Cse2/CasB [Actinomadura latina]NKZ09089.1 type I-E CRISPR-associated protein Cse2/CasB [Actinomadura latina]